MAHRQGIESKNVKNVSQRLGRDAKGIHPGKTAEWGSMKGNHATENGRTKGDPLLPKFVFPPHNSGQRLGNEVAQSTVCGPGGSRNLYGKSGTQGQQGAANQGQAPAKNHDILRDYGPDYRAKGSR